MDSLFTPITRCLIVLSLLAGGAISARSQDGGDPDPIFRRANQIFEEGDFARAENLYRNLIVAGHASAELYFNLGNAVFRQDQLGEAVLWYRRALMLDPRMAEARQNLRFLKKRLGYLQFEYSGLDAQLSKLREGEIVAVFSAGIWLALLTSAAMLVFEKLRSWRTLLGIVSALAIAAAITSARYWRKYRTEFSITNQAIVIAPESRALTGPFPDAENVIDLPPGSELRVLQDRGVWIYVAIPGDLRGFVRAEMIEPIAFDSKLEAKSSSLPALSGR